LSNSSGFHLISDVVVPEASLIVLEQSVPEGLLASRFDDQFRHLVVTIIEALVAWDLAFRDSRRLQLGIDYFVLRRDFHFSAEVRMRLWIKPFLRPAENICGGV